MSTQTFTESQILTRYLLPPSSLPTIIPYKTFLTLLPSNLNSSISTDQALASAVHKLYNDLHFQRTITLDIVSSNIERECARSGTLIAKLAQALQRELVVFGHARGVKRKRDDHDEGISPTERSQRTEGMEEEDEDEEEEIEDSENDQNSSHASSPSSQPSKPTEPNLTDLQPWPRPNQQSTPPPSPPSHNPLHSPRTALIDHVLHGPFGSTLPPTAQRYHNTASLMQSMSTAISDLGTEIKSIDAESESMLKQMEESVGALSDLRYGKFARVSGGAEEEGGLEDSVVVALRDVTGRINGKIGRRGGRV